MRMDLGVARNVHVCRTEIRGYTMWYVRCNGHNGVSRCRENCNGIFQKLKVVMLFLK
jgi:hypothetical protein